MIGSTLIGGGIRPILGVPTLVSNLDSIRTVFSRFRLIQCHTFILNSAVRLKVRLTLLLTDKYFYYQSISGGEGGIRTRGTVEAVRTLSKRVP